MALHNVYFPPLIYLVCSCFERVKYQLIEQKEFRDFTSFSGHYLIFEGGTHADGQIARLISPEFLPTQNSDCKVSMI